MGTVPKRGVTMRAPKAVARMEFAVPLRVEKWGRSMKSRCVALLVASMLASSGAIAEPKTVWTPFQPPGDGFRIEFPGTPMVTNDTVPSTVGPAPHLSAELSFEGSICAVELTTYAAASPPDVALDLFVSAVTKDAKLRAQTRLKVGGDPARRLIIEMEDGKVVLTVLAVTDGIRFYHARCVSPRGQETSASVKHFIDSFQRISS